MADATYRKVLWRLLPFLVLCYVLAFIDRSNVGITKLDFTRDLGFSEAAYGFGAGIFYLGYVLLEIPSNLLLARIGVRKTLLRIMLLWGAACSALAFMQTTLHFNVLRFILGAAEAGLFPGMLLYLTYWVPAARRARATAIFMASIPIAGVLGGPIAGAITLAFKDSTLLHGWQWVFLLEGLPAVVLGLVAFFYLDDQPGDAKWLSTEEKQLIESDLAAERRNKAGAVHGSMGAALRDPRMYMLGALGFAIMVSTGGLFLWLPTILRKSGVQGVFEIGMLSAIPFAIACVAQYLNARHSDRTQERRWHAIIPSLIAAVGWALLPSVADDTTLALLVLCLAAGGTIAAMGPFWSLPPTLVSQGAAAGGIAMISTIAAAGNFISPYLVGWLSDTTGSLAIGQYYFASLFVFGAILMLIGIKAQPGTPAVSTR